MSTSSVLLLTMPLSSPSERLSISYRDSAVRGVIRCATLDSMSKAAPVRTASAWVGLISQLRSCHNWSFPQPLFGERRCAASC
jgi:hypothetical protein